MPLPFIPLPSIFPFPTITLAAPVTTSLKLPFVSASVVDVLISALRSGGYLASDASADAIRSAPNTLDATARDALAASLSYGSGGGGGGTVQDRISGLDDVYCFVDSDNAGPTNPYTKYFYIRKGEAAPGGNNANHRLMQIGSPSDTNHVAMTLGPATNFSFGGVAAYTAGINLGCNVTGGSVYHFGTVTGGDAVVGFGGTVTKGLSLRAGSDSLELVHGLTTTSGARMYLRSSDMGIDSCLSFKQLDEHTYRFSAIDSGAGDLPEVYFSGTFPSEVADPSVYFVIGGAPGVVGISPKLLPKYSEDAGSYRTSSTLAISPTNSSGAVFYTHHRADNATLKAAVTAGNVPSLVVFHSDYQPAGADTSTFNYLAVQATTMAGLAQRVMTVKSTGHAFLANDAMGHACAWHTTGADVAEWFSTAEPADQYAPGTVLVMGPEGRVQASSQVADPRVVGAVSTAPGVVLGSNTEDDSAQAEDYSYKVKIAMCATVPVQCSDFTGPIDIGTLLVSGPAGKAVRSPEPKLPGTIIGKALERLEYAFGTIKMLAMIQ
jgi:hypothetical protein